MAMPSALVGDHPLHRLWGTILLLALVLLAGAIGYHLLARTAALDSLYMAVITLFTVGFREMGEVNGGPPPSCSPSSTWSPDWGLPPTLCQA